NGTGDSYRTYEGIVNGTVQDIPTTPNMLAMVADRLADPANPLTRDEMNGWLAEGKISQGLVAETLPRIRERENADWKARNGNHHPTVKPTDLMAYLCRLVTPPGGVVLDPFMGSGSTGKAAVREGFRFIGIEREPEYVEIARARISAVAPEALSVDDLI
ncbi:MAG TPA: site-specific DNA-methyltransferase, partial [Quisquiliibacterium sp.]|nr:site-specific DNA-methyltransferase [Quisquiliibacterium sp.]